MAKKKKERERPTGSEGWNWHIICEEFHELADFAEGSYTSREFAAMQGNCSREQPSCDDNSWARWGEKYHASIRCLALGNYTVALPQRPPGTLPREGAGGMDHWRTERTHGCPALAGPMRRWNKRERHQMENSMSLRPRVVKSLAQVRPNCRMSLMTTFSPLSPPTPTC